MSSLRDKNILTTAERYRLWNRNDVDKCIRAGWLTPCAQMPTPTGSRPRWSRAALEQCEARILGGEAPEALTGRAAA